MILKPNGGSTLVEYGITPGEDQTQDESPIFTFLSYGGGVQSTALLLLAIEGKLPRPDAVIFSDTGAEMPETIRLIEEVFKPACEGAGIQFVTVESHRGSIVDDYLRKSAIPMVMNRSCTFNFKVAPIRRWLRKNLEIKRGVISARCLLGISTDESQRRTKSDVKYVENKFPLLELGLSRRQCKEMIEAKGWPVPPKSGCYICPFQNVKSWMTLRDEHPKLFEVAVKMEERMLEDRPEREQGFLKKPRRLKNLTGQATLKPWAQIFDDHGESPECTSGSCFL